MKPFLCLHLFLFLFCGCSILERAAPYHAATGNPDLDQMLAIFARDCTPRDGLDFRMDHRVIHGSWACVMVTPLVDGKDWAEPRWSLFHKKEGVWSEVPWEQGVKFRDDFELIDLPGRNSRIARLIVAKYPGCPLELFPMDECP